MRELLHIYFVQNAKTTISGIVSIALGVNSLREAFNPFNEAHLTGAITNLILGFGLLVASDTRKLVKAETVQPGDKVVTEREQ